MLQFMRNDRMNYIVYNTNEYTQKIKHTADLDLQPRSSSAVC